METPDASTPDTPAERTPAPWRTSVAVLAVVIAGMGAFHSVLQGTTWWFAVFFIVVVVLGVAAGVRAFVRVPGLPALASALAGAMVLGQYFGAPTTFLGLPTFDTVDVWSDLARTGAASIERQSVPARADDGILFLVCLGVAVLAIIADVVAVSLRSPALVGVAMIPVAFAPMIITRGDADLFWLAATALAFLWLLGAGRSNGRRGWDSAAIGSTALVAALVVPLVMPPGPSGAGTGSGGGGGSIASGVNPLVSLGQNLRREGARSALSYSTASGQQHYLRLLSFDQVADDGWRPGLFDPYEGETIALAVPGLDDGVQRTPEQSFISVDQLGGKWLPVPYPAVSVTGLRRTAEWDEASLSLRSAGSTVQGESYTIESLLLQPTEEQLQAAGSTVPQRYTEFAVAGEGWPQAIADTAREVTAGSATGYERAAALQRYLRSGDFVYSETAPVEEGYDGTGADVIGVFLDVKSGYCVHYASAMALMARTLGIPARLAVGFLPGEEMDDDDDDGRTRWQVTSQELHAWPELFFDGIGWVAFEPTSSRGVEPVFAPEAEQGAEDGAQPSASAAPQTPTSSTGPSGGPERGDVGGADGGSGLAEEAGSPWGVTVLIAGVLLLLVPAAARVVLRGVRMRRLRLRRAHPSLAWQEVMQTAVDLGIDVAPTATPRANAEVLRGAFGAPASGAPGDGLDAVVDAVERSSFSRSAGVEPPSRAAVVAVLRGLRRAAGWRERLRAAAWPRSLVTRVVRTIS